MRKLYCNIAAHTLVLAAITAFFFLFVFSPQKASIGRFHTMVKNKVHEIEESLDALGDITGENTEMSSLRDKVETARGRFAPYDGVGDVALELADRCRQLGMTPTRVIPPMEWRSEERVVRTVPGLVIVEVPVVIETSGTFAAHGRFLETLDGFPYYVTPVEMSMGTTVPGKGPVSCSTRFLVYALRRSVPPERDENEA